MCSQLSQKSLTDLREQFKCLGRKGKLRVVLVETPKPTHTPRWESKRIPGVRGNSIWLGSNAYRRCLPRADSEGALVVITLPFVDNQAFHNSPMRANL